MRETVAIIGGGVAGLSTAHELIERGFNVHVYERRAFFGGKAASYRVPRPCAAATPPAPAGTEVGQRANGSINGSPGEHGFRFFPGWYRHLIDTMSRIPYHRPDGGRRTVLDNLVSVRANLLAWFDRAPIALPLRVPRSAAEAAGVSQFLEEFGRLGLTSSEVTLFFGKLMELAVLPDDRRAEVFEGISWWDFLECGQPGRSRAYQDLARATTRTMVAARAEEASAFTIGRLAIRTLLDTMSSVDRVLNGPTNEVWFDPWIAHLQARGVVFHREMELLAIQFDATTRKVASLQMQPLPVTNARRLRRLILRFGRTGTVPGQETAQEAAELAKELRESTWLNARASSDETRSLTNLVAELEHLPSMMSGGAADRARRALLAVQLARFEADESDQLPITADQYVLALPLEQLAYYVNRSTMLTFLAPELRDVLALSRHMDWMAGIQFYFRTPLDIAPGHLVGLDSTWALTAIEHTQFWKHIALPEGVKAILSVDIAAWDKKGRILHKEAYNCSDREIADEVWGQLKEMLNKIDRAPALRNDMLIGGGLTRNVSYHIDDSLIDLRDRKKQAFYERARGVRFDTLELIVQGKVEKNGNVARDRVSEPYMWGPRRRFNAEPLLVNRAGSRRLRPSASTSIPNLFLAGDYVRTDTDLACMEGANEAARRAVNGILDAAASRESRCELWPFSPTRQALEGLTSIGGALDAVRGAASAVSELRDRLWKSVAGNLIRIQTRLPSQRTRPGGDTYSRR